MKMKGKKSKKARSIGALLLFAGLLLGGLPGCKTGDYGYQYDSKGACIDCPGRSYFYDPSPTVGGGP
jgi:hypothetical protein